MSYNSDWLRRNSACPRAVRAPPNSPPTYAAANTSTDAISSSPSRARQVLLENTSRWSDAIDARSPLAPCTSPASRGNATALGQVFRNLIDNARSFSRPGGEVRIFLAPPTEKHRSAQVIVDDDGPGVPADALEKIFSRFYTKRPQGSAFGNNSGLGLAISRQIVVSHGGVIWAENRADEKGAPVGARFVVELPTA